MTTEEQEIQLEVVWTAHRAGDPRALDVLVEAYLPLVRYTAYRMRSQGGQTLPIDGDDLIQFGSIGLLDAIQKFDPERGAFPSYAMSRIKGSIIDSMRKMDWAPRSLRPRARAMDDVFVKLEHELGRSPTMAEVATVAGVSEREVSRLYAEVRGATVWSLEEQLNPDAGSDAPEDVGQSLSGGMGSIDLPMEVEEAGRNVARAIPRLSEDDRTVLALYYFENMDLREMAKALGVREARASQIHTRALSNLHRVLVGL